MEMKWIVYAYIVLLHIVSGSLTNIGQGKPASMSSVKETFSADTAVDGNTVVAPYGPQNVIDTGGGYRLAWWKVDLQRQVQDAAVMIYFRTDYTLRRNGVKLYTSTSPFPDSNPTSQGQLCHTVTGDPSGRDIPDVYNVTCPGRWRYLLLYTDTDNDGQGPVLDFGEVEVYACSDGTYEEDCIKNCSFRNCVNMTTTCEKDGRCSNGCQSGWTGVDCTQECESGFYGPGCSLSCTDRKCLDSSSQCDHMTGQCECKLGYMGTDCRQRCGSDFYGPGCSLSCTDRKCFVTSSSCNHVTGQCVGGCEAGFNGTNCIEACSPGITYGVNCETSCSSRHCVTSSPLCDRQTGQCPDGCESEWRGMDSCPRGTYGSDCRGKCSYCDGVCDSVDGRCPDGCLEGYYGPYCSEMCGYCDGICDSVDGRCPAGCLEGYYGPYCSEMCGNCDGVCDRVNGLCYVGCQDGYRGAWCNVTRTTDNNTLVGAVVGTFLGTLLIVVLLVVGVQLILIRQGRLHVHWVRNPEDKKTVQMSRDVTQMTSIAAQPADVSEHAHSRSHVYNNDYAVLDAEHMTGNKDYDVIQHKEYQNI